MATTTMTGTTSATVIDIDVPHHLQSQLPSPPPLSADPKFPLPPPSPAANVSAPIPLDDLNHEPSSQEPSQPPSAARTNLTRQKQRWNSPRINTFRIAVAFLSLFNLGINDASAGPLLPSLESYYSLDYTLVSLIFLSPFLGYSLASFLNDRLHHSAGQRGIALLGPLTRAGAYLILTFHPPWPAVVIVLAVGGFGSGLCDAAWNAWVGDFAAANQLLGLLHGFYGLGATVAPIIVTALVANPRQAVPWWYWFYIPLALCVAEAAAGAAAFWAEDGAVFRARMREQGEGRVDKRLRAALSIRVTWLVALFLFLYVGAEVSLGGWIVTFMLRVRGSTPFAAGVANTGFWAGLTLGRVTLGFLTPRLGERLAVAVYLLVALALELLFWLVPSFYVSAVAIALLGYFIGPLFPAAIVAATKLLPKQLHIPAIGFAAAVGGGGAAVLPFAVGAIAQVKGVATLEPIVLAILVVLLGMWLALPRIPRKERGGDVGGGGKDRGKSGGKWRRRDNWRGKWRWARRGGRGKGKREGVGEGKGKGEEERKGEGDGDGRIKEIELEEGLGK